MFADKTALKMRAVLVGERIDLKGLETAHRVAVAPLVLPAGDQGCTVLFRYGAVVFCDVSPVEQASFLKSLQHFVSEPFTQPQTEDVEIRNDGNRDEGPDQDGIYLHDFSLERIQLIADILAKSVLLAHYEASIAETFDRIEPLAADLQTGTFNRLRGKELLRHLGRTLAVQHKTVGRAEVEDKPELLWDRPKLERLYLRVENEYELRERLLALERKLELISRTAQTLLSLFQDRRSHRVEWYIVILIVIEILLTLVQMFRLQH